MNIQISVIVENLAQPPFVAELGLALLIRCNEHRMLFDTGAGNALLPNAALMNVALKSIRDVVLSHGHKDHTGGLAGLMPERIWHTPEITVPHFSRHPERPVSNISMPDDAVRVLHSAEQIVVDSFRKMMPGVYLTGPIPRISGETAGGPFYHDPEGHCCDVIADEQAMLFENGVLIQGCCHAGIINTLEYCRKCAPEIHVHSIVGGLHLLHADEERLKQTADYLHQNGVKTLYLMHCTGANAIDYMKNAGLTVITPTVGECFSAAE